MLRNKRKKREIHPIWGVFFFFFEFLFVCLFAFNLFSWRFKGTGEGLEKVSLESDTEGWGEV